MAPPYNLRPRRQNAAYREAMGLLRKKPRKPRTPAPATRAPGAVVALPAAPNASETPQTSTAIESSKPDPSSYITRFDQLKAYERLVETKQLTRERYREANFAFMGVKDRTAITKARLTEARKKKRVWRKVRKSTFAAGPTVTTEDEMEDIVFDGEGGEDDGYGGTDWGLHNTGDSLRQRGEELDKGDWPGMEPRKTKAVDLFSLHRGNSPPKQQPKTKLVYDKEHHCLREAQPGDPEYDMMQQTELEWEEVTSPTISKPDSLFDEDLMDAKEAHQEAKKASDTAWEEMRSLRSDEARYERMIKDLQKQYPELRMIVDFGDAHERERKRRQRVADQYQDDKEILVPASPKDKNDIPKEYEKAVADWLEHCTQVLKSHATLTEFPNPPHWRCKHDTLNCFFTFEDHHNVPAKKVRFASSSPLPSLPLPKRPLAACEHNLRAIFNSVPHKHLRKYLVLFHPDKFAWCPVEEDIKMKWQVKASEIFVLISAIEKSSQEILVESFGKMEQCSCKQEMKDAGKCDCGFAAQERRKYGAGWGTRVR